MIARLHNKQQAAGTLHLRLLLLVVIGAAVSTSSAGAQLTALFLPPSCNFQDVNLAPCMVASSGNISGACCSSLNRALDAGHRCVCSLLLSNGAVFASLVTNLLTLPLVLPLPGCFLYAPSLAACQATTIQQQTDTPPTATSTVVASTGPPARMADPPTPPAATALPPPEKTSEKKKGNAGPGKASDGVRSTARNGTSDAAPPAGQIVSRSGACRRRPGNAAHALTLLTAVAVSWISGLTIS